MRLSLKKKKSNWQNDSNKKTKIYDTSQYNIVIKKNIYLLIINYVIQPMLNYFSLTNISSLNFR